MSVYIIYAHSEDSIPATTYYRSDPKVNYCYFINDKLYNYTCLTVV